MADRNDIPSSRLGQESDYRREGMLDDENVELAAAEADALRTAQLFMLGRMRGIAMDMANALNRKAQALAFDGGFPGLGDIDPVLAFTRLSRSVLQMMAMEQQIMGVRESKRAEARQRRSSERRARTERQVRREVSALVSGRVPDIDRDHLADLMDDIFREVLDDADPDFAGLSQHEIVARICTELRIRDPDLSIWPDEKPGDSAPADDAADDGTDPPFPGALATALGGSPSAPAYANGHDPP